MTNIYYGCKVCFPVITLEEAKAMMTKENIEHLHDITTVKPDIDFSHKVNNDIIMAALCKAVADGVIKPTSISDRLTKLLNSETNTISQSKLEEILHSIHDFQPNIRCCVTVYDHNMIPKHEWEFSDKVSFLSMFDWVVNNYEITPVDIRKRLTQTLKTTIVNNVSQLVSKWRKSTLEERSKMVISITTIQRLVNMTGDILQAEFYEK